MMADDLPGAPALRHLFSIRAALTSRVDAGPGPTGRRSFNGVAEATFAGDRMRGTFAAGSGDWMLTRPDGVNVVDARVMVVTDDGAPIYMSFAGRVVIPPAVLVH